MQPISNLPAACLVTLVLLVGGAWLSSLASGHGQIDSTLTQPNHGGLHVLISGTRNSTGNIVITVYDNADAYSRYDDEDIAAYTVVPASTDTMTIEFPGLTEGPYAVTIFHDEDSDAQFDMDGDYPVEGYGTSGARGAYDEPPFDRAAALPGAVLINMFYL